MECQCDTKIYSCTAEDVLIWEIKNEVDTGVFIQSFSAHDSIGVNYTRRVTLSSIAEAELTYKNFSQLRGILKVSGVHTLLGHYVVCARERIEITTGDSDACK